MIGLELPGDGVGVQRIFQQNAPQGIKSFLLLFFKKEVLPYSSCSRKN
jgi:hypothetical protein